MSTLLHVSVVCSALLWRCSTHLSRLITALHSWPFVFSVQLSILSMEMFGPVQWMALSWGWSPTLLPCCRAPSPALITMLYVFSVWYSPCWLSLCATCSQYAREMNVRLMRVSNQKYKRTCGLPFCVRLRFVPTVSDLLVNHWCILRFVMRSPSLTCKMPFAAFPSPHHPITFNFCTLEGKKSSVRK